APSPGYSPVSAQIGGLSGIIALAANSDHTVAVKDDGTVLHWGGDGFGRTADANLRIVQAAIRLVSSVLDTDQDGMLDSAEIEFFGNLSRPGWSDADGDQITDAQELFLGTSPTDFYNGAAVTLTLIGGNNQTTRVGLFNSMPFDV